MVKKIAGIGALLLLLVVVGKLQARPPMDVGLDYFYDSLAPYGEWISMNPWGWVWCPYDIGVDWRPYTVGNWDYSDYGWTFVSDEPWAWATYHYGRWGFDDDCGWYWVPDSVWGPAWVGWRFGGGLMGWCPLPPGIRWRLGFGLDFGGFDLDDVGWSRWNFCELGHFADRDLRRFVFEPARNVNLLRMTRNVTNYSFADNRIINNNIPLSDIERAMGRNVTHYRIAEAPGGLSNPISQIRGNEIQMFRPQVSSRSNIAAPRNVLPRRVTGVTAQQLQQRHDQERRTLTQRFNTQSNDMQRRHQQETGRQSQMRGGGTARGTRREDTPDPAISNDPMLKQQQETQMRQQAERQALQEQQRRETRVLQNRQKRESDQHQYVSRSQGSQAQKPTKKNP